MKAFYIVEPGKTEIRDIPVPEPGPGEVLLRVSYAGFCGGDLNALRGTFPLQEYPNILGHEVGATIETAADGVPGSLVPGTHVTISPYDSCGTCSACRNDRPNACKDNRTMGVRRPGAMTPYITVRYQDVVPSSKLTARELALVEPLSVGFHAAARGRVTASDTVAVFGAGMVGLGTIAAAAFRGANVIAIDVDDRKMAAAKKAGAAHTVNSQKENLHDALMELTDGNGPGVVIEAVGNAQTYRAAVEEVAFTGRVVYIGYAKTPVEYETSLFVMKELDILGSRNCLGDFPSVIEMLEKGTFPLDDVVSREVTLEGAAGALSDWNRDPGAFTKILVRIE